jgi:hypothetical protein
MLESKLAAIAAAEGALAAAKWASQSAPATDWICDKGGLHDVGAPCGCTDE